MNHMSDNDDQIKDLESSLRELLSDVGREKENVLSSLQLIQERFRYLPEESLDFISEDFDVPLAKVYGIATFFSQFSFQPRGDHTIRICRGTACHIKGAEMVSDRLHEEFGFVLGEVSDDGRFFLTTVRCLGCCAKAPVMMIDDEVYGNLDEEKISEAVENYL